MGKVMVEIYWEHSRDNRRFSNLSFHMSFWSLPICWSKICWRKKHSTVFEWGSLVLNEFTSLEWDLGLLLGAENNDKNKHLWRSAYEMFSNTLMTHRKPVTYYCCWHVTDEKTEAWKVKSLDAHGHSTDARARTGIWFSNLKGLK
jgi:hypothetical protein